MQWVLRMTEFNLNQSALTNSNKFWENWNKVSKLGKKKTLELVSDTATLLHYIYNIISLIISENNFWFSSKHTRNKTMRLKSFMSRIPKYKPDNPQLWTNFLVEGTGTCVGTIK